MAVWGQDIEKGGDFLDKSNSPTDPGVSEPTTPKTATLQTLSSEVTVSQSSTKALLNSKARRNCGCFTSIKLPRLATYRSPARAKPKPLIRRIHEQKRGYPQLATFLDCDENFMLYRRFGYLQSRLLLEKQDDLAKLELKLEILETKEYNEDDESLMTRTHLQEDRMKEKVALWRAIEKTWNDYCKLITNASKMTSLNKPTNVEHQHVTQWMHNNGPLKAPDRHFIRHREDLVTLRPGREHAWLDSCVETFLRWSSPLPIKRLFQSQDTREKSDGSDGCQLYTRSRIERFVITIITCLVLGLLIVPTYLLYHITTTETRRVSLKCMFILLVATLAFTACVSLCSRARSHEVMAASAAYCAVLVVFIGNFSDHTPISHMIAM